MRACLPDTMRTLCSLLVAVVVFSSSNAFLFQQRGICAQRTCLSLSPRLSRSPTGPNVANLSAKKIDTEVNQPTEEERRQKQQIGAAAVVIFAVLFDFFVTHHGVGFWDPNYVV